MQKGDKLLRRREVEELTGLSCTALYRHMRAGTFPLPIKLGAGAVHWPESEIFAHLASLPRATGRAAA